MGTGSVGRKLVRPELSPHLTYLVARLLAFRIRGEHVVVASVAEHLEKLGGGLLEEHDRREVNHVLAVKRRRGLQAVESRLGRLVGGERLLDPGAEVGPAEIPRHVEDLTEAHSQRASLDVAVDRPKRANVLLFGGGEGRPGRLSRARGGRRRSDDARDAIGADARFAVDRKEYKAGDACQNCA